MISPLYRARIRFLTRLAILVLASCLFGCGLDTIAYLPLKTELVTNDLTAKVFRGPSSDDESYQGLIIFYKIHASEASASVDVSLIATKQSAVNAIPGVAVETYLASAGGLNYQKLVLDGIMPFPTIPKEYLTDEYYTTIDFPARSNTEPTLSITSNTRNPDGSLNHLYTNTIKRAATGSAGEYLSFLDKPQTGNPDFLSGATTLPNVYYVQLFAVAYGFDLTDISDLYGDAVSLGLIELKFW